ncbi:MAG: radical SAM protein [Gemmatimonadaceae bacterium]
MPRRAFDIGFELTNLCNLHCTHCIRGSHQSVIDRLELALIRDILDQAQELFDPLEVVFTGGEPLAADLFAPVVAELAGRHISYRFVTNGWLVPRHLPLFIEFPPRFARVSLSGGNAATHDAMRGKGSFRHALLGAAVLMSRHIRVDFSMVVTCESRDELLECLMLSERMGVAELHFILPQPTPESAANKSDLSPAEWKQIASQVYDLSRTSSVTVKLDYGSHMPLPMRLKCATLETRQLYVDARARAIFCCQLARYGTGEEPVIGDLRTESLASVIARAESSYGEFSAETSRRHLAGQWDDLDDFPCMSCARRHARTGFLASYPEHPWAALAEPT